MKNKVCKCPVKDAWYYDLGVFKCQYCDGVLTDLAKVKAIIDYNTPTNLSNRDKRILERVKEHKRFLDKLKIGKKYYKNEPKFYIGEECLKKLKGVK